jgi:hypothetical protein
MCQRVKPRFVVFGHIHEGYGVEIEDETVYITLWGKCAHEPIVFDVIPKSRGLEEVESHNKIERVHVSEPPSNKS